MAAEKDARRVLVDATLVLHKVGEDRERSFDRPIGHNRTLHGFDTLQLHNGLGVGASTEKRRVCCRTLRLACARRACACRVRNTRVGYGALASKKLSQTRYGCRVS